VPDLRGWLIVIILSSSIYEGDIERAYELGANVFLVEPSSAKVLIDMCRAIKHFWLTHNRPPIVPQHKIPRKH
jgi:DNA-binding NarL/FixJ family response regulator